MVRHRQPRRRLGLRSGGLSPDIEAAARQRHRLRTGLYRTQVPRHRAYGSGRQRGLPQHNRRRRRRHAARGGQRPVHTEAGSALGGHGRRDSRRNGQRLDPHVRHSETLFGGHTRHTRGAHVLAGCGRSRLRRGALPPEAANGQRRRHRLRRRRQPYISALEDQGANRTRHLHVEHGARILLLQVDGRQDMGRRQTDIQQSAVQHRYRHRQVQRRRHAAAARGRGRRRSAGYHDD